MYWNILILRRTLNPDWHPAPFPKIRVIGIKNADFVISSEDQTKVKSTCLRRVSDIAGKINHCHKYGHRNLIPLANLNTRC